MRITTDRVRKDILTLRTWLGPNPRTGRPHIPDNRLTDAARTRGRGAYQVEGLLVDADLFRRLRVRGETRGPDGLDDLRQALSLVIGTPSHNYAPAAPGSPKATGSTRSCSARSSTSPTW